MRAHTGEEAALSRMRTGLRKIGREGIFRAAELQEDSESEADIDQDVEASS